MSNSEYDVNSEWSLACNCNTHRGEILDGTRASPTPSVSWENGKMYGVNDGSVHYRIQQFLETQPEKKATVNEIFTVVILLHGKPEYHLRELKKQGICVRK